MTPTTLPKVVGKILNNEALVTWFLDTFRFWFAGFNFLSLFLAFHVLGCPVSCGRESHQPSPRHLMVYGGGAITVPTPFET